MHGLREEEKVRLIIEGGLDAVVNSELASIGSKNTTCYKSSSTISNCVNELVSDLLSFHVKNQNIWPFWQIGNSLTTRLTSRVANSAHSELLTMVLLILPGTILVYYGDEIGMRDLITWKQFPQRGSMLWDSSMNSGFSVNQSLGLPFVSSDFSYINYQRQTNENVTRLKMFTRMTHLRQESDTLKLGHTYIAKSSGKTIAICRYITDNFDKKINGKVFVLIVNFGWTSIVQSLSDLPPFRTYGTYTHGKVVAFSSNARMRFKLGMKLDLDKRTITIGPNEGVTLSILPS